MMNVVTAKTFSGADAGVTESDWYRSTNLFNAGKFIHEEYDRFEELYMLNREDLAPQRKLTYESIFNSYIFIIPLKGSLMYQGMEHGNITVMPGEVLSVPSGKRHSYSVYNLNDADPIQFLQVGFITSDSLMTQMPRLREIDHVHELNGIHPIRFGAPHFPFQICYGVYEARQQDEVNWKDPHTHAFVYVLHGSMIVEHHLLQKGDAIGIWNSPTLKWQSLIGLNQFLLINFSVPEPKLFYSEKRNPA